MNQLRVCLKNAKETRSYSIAEFEKLFNIRYLKHLQFDNWCTEQWIRKKCAKAYKKQKIASTTLWLGQLHARALEKESLPNATIRWIHDKIGYGLVTNEVIQPWQMIGEYTGTLRRRNLFFANVNDYCFMYPREWVATKAFTIDSEKSGNFTRFINHSDTPNCESISAFCGGVFRIIFRAIKKINTGEELTYDYGEIYWKRRKKYLLSH